MLSKLQQIKQKRHNTHFLVVFGINFFIGVILMQLTWFYLCMNTEMQKMMNFSFIYLIAYLFIYLCIYILLWQRPFNICNGKFLKLFIILSSLAGTVCGLYWIQICYLYFIPYFSYEFQQVNQCQLEQISAFEIEQIQTGRVEDYAIFVVQYQGVNGVEYGYGCASNRYDEVIYDKYELKLFVDRLCQELDLGDVDQFENNYYSDSNKNIQINESEFCKDQQKDFQITQIPAWMCMEWDKFKQMMKNNSNEKIVLEECYQSQYGNPEKSLNNIEDQKLSYENQQLFQDNFNIIKLEKDTHYSKYEAKMDQAFLLTPACMFISMPIAIIIAQIFVKQDLIQNKKDDVANLEQINGNNVNLQNQQQFNQVEENIENKTQYTDNMGQISEDRGEDNCENSQEI